MAMEFKWIVSFEIDTEDYKEASRAVALAQDAFFDSLTSDDLEWKVLDEELK